MRCIFDRVHRIPRSSRVAVAMQLTIRLFMKSLTHTVAKRREAVSFVCSQPRSRERRRMQGYPQG
ncbi:hypothetical protein ABH899_002812 [Paenibacillus sp. RC84]